MLNIIGLGHINVVVGNIAEGINYYQTLFRCVPQQSFPHFRNKGFALSAGFMENSEEVDVSICFLQIPGTSIVLELMEYHSPSGEKSEKIKKTTDMGNVGHICLKVKDINTAFSHINSIPETRLISSDKNYRPVFISPVRSDEFYFFDPLKESDPVEKETVCNIIKNIRYFYFVDKYNVQWEFEEGHSDIGE